MQEVRSKGMAGNIPVFCSFDKIVPLSEMKPNPKNPNKHPQEQVELLAKIIRVQGWRAPVTVSTLSGMIVRGHGRYEAAKLLDCPVPVDFQDYATESDELSDLLADNRIAELADLDKAALADIFKEIDAVSIAESLSGYTKDDIDQVLQEVAETITESDLDEFFVDAPPKEKEHKKIQCPHCGELFER